MQDELDNIAEIWNTHTIRRSKNEHVPCGRPDLMYFVPIIWGSDNHLCSIPDEEIDVCSNEAEFRSTIPCDADVYNLCINIMKRQNFDPPNDTKSALDMYQYIRNEFATTII